MAPGTTLKRMTTNGKHDVNILRDLLREYVAVTQDEVQDERRELWRQHNSLVRTRPPVVVSFGPWNVWCQEVFGDHVMQCQDPFFRRHELALRQMLFHASLGDDTIFEPWITQRASTVTPDQGLWGLREGRIPAPEAGGAWKFDPPLKDPEDAAKMRIPSHVIDEERTARNIDCLRQAIGDLIEVNLDRGPAYRGFGADISTNLARLRGLEPLMTDMLDRPDWLHSVLQFMRDGILKVHREAEEAGDWSLSTQSNQAACYSRELEPPRPNSGSRPRRELWYFAAAQEFTGISPSMHHEFLLQYQLPIMAEFGLVAYGCCEDLTNKIDMLRQVPNLRRIAVTPVADVGRCAEQIQADYVFSWRPNPTNVISFDFDESRVRRVLAEGLAAARGCHVDITLKDIETVGGEPERLGKWVQIARGLADDW